MDLVVVSDPGQIKQIDESGDVDRLHAFPSKSLPLWVRFFFRATKFHDDRRDLWFSPFESASNPTYPGRREYLVAKVSEGYTTDDVTHIADLLTSNADDEALCAGNGAGGQPAVFRTGRPARDLLSRQGYAPDSPRGPGALEVHAGPAVAGEDP